MHRNTCLYPTIYGILLYLLNPSVPFLSGFKSTFLAPRASGRAHLQTIITQFILWLGRPICAHVEKKQLFRLLCHLLICVTQIFGRPRPKTLFTLPLRLGAASHWCVCPPPPNPAQGSQGKPLARGPGSGIQTQSRWWQLRNLDSWMLFPPEKIQWETLFVCNLRESPKSELLEGFKGMYSAPAHLHPLSVPNQGHSGCWSLSLQHRGRWWDPPQDTHTPGTMWHLNSFQTTKVVFRWRGKTHRGAGTTRNRLGAAVLPVDPSNSTDPELRAPPGRACTFRITVVKQRKDKKTHYKDRIVKASWDIAEVEWRVSIGNLCCWNTNMSSGFSLF